MKMNTSVNSESATIYQFPAGGRAAFSDRRCGETKAAADQSSDRASDIACSSGWYHEDAIRESSPGDGH